MKRAPVRVFAAAGGAGGVAAGAEAVGAVFVGVDVGWFCVVGVLLFVTAVTSRGALG